MEGIEIEKKLPFFFKQLLGLVEPWYITKVEHTDLEVHIHIDFERGAKFLYSIKESCAAYTIPSCENDEGVKSSV